MDTFGHVCPYRRIQRRETAGAATPSIVGQRRKDSPERPRGREIDIAIAACAIAHDAQLWTVNADDFKDIPNLKLLRFAPPPRRR